GAYDLVVGPAVAVEHVALASAGQEHLPQVVRHLPALEVLPQPQQRVLDRPLGRRRHAPLPSPAAAEGCAGRTREGTRTGGADGTDTYDIRASWASRVGGGRSTATMPRTGGSRAPSAPLPGPGRGPLLGSLPWRHERTHRTA